MLIIRTINLLVSAWLILTEKKKKQTKKKKNKMCSYFIQNWWFMFTNCENKCQCDVNEIIIFHIKNCSVNQNHINRIESECTLKNDPGWFNRKENVKDL